MEEPSTILRDYYAPGVDEERDLFRSMLGRYFLEAKKRRVEVHGVEIGVLNGATSAFLLSLSPRIHLIGIDPLLPDTVEPSLIGSREVIDANTERFKDRWQFVHYWSHGVVGWFVDNSLDFVFIDGSHIYEDVKLDYRLYLPKVRHGGLLFFHDSRMNRGGPDFWAGPSQLVDEIIEDDKRVKLVGEAFTLTCFERV